ncbi:flagellar biosynthesis protein FlgL [Novosphingobium sp. JCM 18896]|uniref:flagellin N-terminal helical domain-containing protein n=1 Tax=Novosphingobium sp. JCM 18896 TaxID=2989731 RepID=UPI0022235D78|nr:flagellar biosynthesis protein FlgL [Novosphingobium sp. JCM 18896]MCW1428839.1 flagellar biosynthesis protein FlgL [Novosphingobium sp. JCM 18896]
MTSISTSTAAFYDRAKNDIGTIRKRAETLQQQLGSGDKLERSSDDPVAASRLRMLARTDKLSNIDESNAGRATADLTLADSALKTFADYITNAKVLANNAANGTITDAQRASIGYEIEQIFGNLINLANSRDSNGHALFGGESSGDAYQLDGTGKPQYIGTGTAGDLALGDGQSISRGLTGPQILGTAPNDILTKIQKLASDLQTGTGDRQKMANDGITMLETSLDQITTSSTLVGSRLNWIDLTSERRTNLGELRADEQTRIGATDLPSTIAELQQTMTVLEASQASFTKLSSLSLFSMLN